MIETLEFLRFAGYIALSYLAIVAAHLVYTEFMAVMLPPAIDNGEAGQPSKSKDGC